MSSSDRVPASNGSLAAMMLILAAEENAGKPTPPDKVTVYEQYFKVPHYIVYNQFTSYIRYFRHNRHYRK